MYSNLRSLIFKIDPERAHFLAIQSLKLNLVSNIFDENKNDPILKTKLFNQDLDNPIGMAAGFDKNAEVYNPLFKLCVYSNTAITKSKIFFCYINAPFITFCYIQKLVYTRLRTCISLYLLLLSPNLSHSLCV